MLLIQFNDALQGRDDKSRYPQLATVHSESRHINLRIVELLDRNEERLELVGGEEDARRRIDRDRECKAKED